MFFHFLHRCRKWWQMLVIQRGSGLCFPLESS